MKSWTIKRIRLAELLQQSRFYSNKSREVVESTLLNLLKSSFDHDALGSLEIVRLYRKQGLRGLEDTNVSLAAKDILITLQELQWLADGYQIKRILLDPILSHPVTNCVSSPAQSIQVDGGHQGHRTKYLTPDATLEGTRSQTAIAFAEIDAGGRSDLHHHVGEELIVVLRGKVEVQFPDSGLSARLSQHDYCHFISAQRHFVENLGDDSAMLLAIRRWPSRSRSQLENRIAEFEDELKVASKEPSDTTNEKLAETAETPKYFKRVRQLFQEIKELLVDQSYDAIPETNDTHVDRRGLGRYLSFIAGGIDQPSNHLSLNTLAERGKKWNLTRSRFQSIQSGKARIAENELIAIAKCYDLMPALLYEFTIPQHGPTVVIRTGTPAQDSTRDFRPLPSDFATTSDASYWIPNRRLRLTNLSVCVLELGPGAKTTTNQHPGQELVIPLSGSIRVDFASTKTADLPSDQFYFAHFESTQTHTVENVDSRSPARALVIRMCDY